MVAKIGIAHRGSASGRRNDRIVALDNRHGRGSARPLWEHAGGGDSYSVRRHRARFTRPQSSADWHAYRQRHDMFGHGEFIVGPVWECCDLRRRWNRDGRIFARQSDNMRRDVWQ